MMSLTPTKPRTSPLASVDTMTLGMPRGRARIAAVPIVVPAPPPMAITASIGPSANAARHNFAGAVGHRRDRAAAVGLVRRALSTSWPAAAATAVRRDRRREGRLAHHTDVDDDRRMAAPGDLISQEREFLALRVERTEHRDIGHGRE